MKNIVIISAALTILALAIAILLSLSGGEREPAAETPPEPPAIDELIPEGARADRDIEVRVLIGDEIVPMSMERFLIGVTASEMPASFEPEALKAQAVAARTDTMYNMQIAQKPRHPDADVCSEFSCCMAYSDDEMLREKWGDNYVEYIMKIIGAVIETDGVYLSYDGEPILAVFHSSSAGKTENSGSVWKVDLPYLVSVPSPETSEQVPNYVSSVTVLRTDFIETVKAARPEAVFGEDEASWITDISYTASGRIASLMLGGTAVTGPELRSMFSLRSTAANIEITDGGVVFTTTGYGHGVGMSQYGANTMATSGSGFEDILTSYYSGVTLSGDVSRLSV